MSLSRQLTGGIGTMKPNYAIRESTEKRLMEPVLYDHLLTNAIEAEVARLGDPRLVALAPMDSEESHSVLAQYLERLITSSLALHRGSDAAEKQRQLVERIVPKSRHLNTLSRRPPHRAMRLQKPTRCTISRAARVPYSANSSRHSGPTSKRRYSTPMGRMVND